MPAEEPCEKLGITEWLRQWERRGWKTADRKPVKNVDLWQQLDQQVRRHSVEWRWVRGHAGDPGNERADVLANRGVEQVLGALGLDAPDRARHRDHRP